jgi:dihydrolipoamide dehydrogenase
MSSHDTIPATARLVVIGAGPGGYAAAFRAVELGLDVTLIDPEADPGGVCLHRGCIPSKALLHVAKLVSDAEEAAGIGVTFSPPQIDLERVRNWKDEVIGKLAYGLAAKVSKLKITYVRGMAQFKDARTLTITTTAGAVGEMAFEQAILATGSRPIVLPGVAAQSKRIIDSTGALELADVPASLLVIGGGYIGLELGSVYAALGSSVSVVEMTAGLLPGCDRDLVSLLKRCLDKKFSEIRLNTRVTGLKEQKSGLRSPRDPGRGLHRSGDRLVRSDRDRSERQKDQGQNSQTALAWQWSHPDPRPR